MIDKIKKIISPSEKDKYLKMIEKFRTTNVPKEYNQIHLMDELVNPEIDHFISISNRTDGKSINYVHALLHVAIEYNVGLTFISRNMMLRTSYQDLIEDVLNISNIYDNSDFQFIRSQYYVSLNYNGKTIAIIVALNDASELKYFSNYIKNFPIMIYDEFLALETEYLPDEWTRLKTLYESIDRIESYPLIHKPKIFYFGNAVNFESPVLHGLKIFNILEHHKLNTAKVYKYDYNVMLEMNRNENSNKKRNLRAFSSGKDAMTTGSFEKNDFTIANNDDRNHVKMNPRSIYIKLKSDYLKIWYNKNSLKIILSIESRIENDYNYNMLLKDNKETSTYLTPIYYDDNHIKKINKGTYLFENNFSKNYITTDFVGLNRLKLNKIIREQLALDTPEKEMIAKEQQFKDNFVENSIKGIFNKFMG